MIFQKTRHIVAAIVFSFSIIIVCAQAAQSASGFRLAELNVYGSKRYESSQITPVTGLKLGDNISLDSLKEAANRLASTGAFASVNYRYRTGGGAMSVTFMVQDTPTMLPCGFANFVWFSRQQLLQELRAHVPLFQGYVPPAGKMLDQVEAQLRVLLKARGIHAQVRYEAQAKLSGAVQGVEFMETGVAIPIQKVEFSGVKQIRVSLLEAAARPLLNQNYDATFIQSFSHGTLREVYLQDGYLEAKFGPPVAQLLPASTTPNAVAVTIPVSEGEQFNLKGIAWAGQSAIPYSKLAKSLPVRTGRPLNELRLQQEALTLPPLFHRIGYIMANVTSKPILDEASHTAVYQIQIEQGDLYRMGTLEIDGVDPSHAEILKGICQLHSGEPFLADYWNTFVKKAFGHLPRLPSGWKARTAIKANADTKTVNVRVIFSPAASL